MRAENRFPDCSARLQRGAAPRSVFNSPDRGSAQARLQTIVAKHAAEAPKLAAWMEENLPQGFTVFNLPTAHQRKLRTSNALERVNQEINDALASRASSQTKPQF